MNKPTKEEVEEFLSDTADGSYCFAYKDFTVILAKAYLALLEEVSEKHKFPVSYGEMLSQSGRQADSAIEQIAQLKAENQALRAKLESSERGSKRTIENLLRSQCDDGG